PGRSGPERAIERPARTPSAVGPRLKERFRGIVCRLAVLGGTAAFGGGEGGLQPRRIEVLGIAWRAGLLTPRLLEPARVDRIETEIVYQSKHLLARLGWIAGNRKG